MEVSIARARPSSSASSFKASRASIRSVYVMYIDENLILTVVKMEELFANAVFLQLERDQNAENINNEAVEKKQSRSRTKETKRRRVREIKGESVESDGGVIFYFLIPRTMHRASFFFYFSYKVSQLYSLLLRYCFYGG